MKLSLRRVSVHREGAFGVLLREDGIPFAATLERTYDELDESGGQATKIPPGVWPCTRTVFHGGKPAPYSTFEILVPDHSRILFHRGNVETDSEGCVLVAERFGELRGKPAVLDSYPGFAEFLQVTRGVDVFDLEVS